MIMIEDMDNLLFQSVPVGSLVNVTEEKRYEYLREIVRLPLNAQNSMFAERTGAYVRGVTKSLQLPDTSAPSISLAIVRVMVGEITLAQLPALLSSELKIANDKAQRIAQEIERDLFAPVALELNQYLAQKKKGAGSIAAKLGSSPTSPPSPNVPSKFPRRPAAPSNILNLKDQRPGPTPPPIPR